MLTRRSTLTATLVGLALSAGAWSCPLQVQNAWIREPPPGVTTLAGYAVLSNTGSAPLRLTQLRSPLFGHVEMHESMLHEGVVMMRPLARLAIAAGGNVRFEPDGKHLMLVAPKRSLRLGEQVPVDLVDEQGCVTRATFVVASAAPH